MKYLIGASIAALLAAPALTGLGHIKVAIDSRPVQDGSSDMCSSSRHVDRKQRQERRAQNPRNVDEGVDYRSTPVAHFGPAWPRELQPSNYVERAATSADREAQHW
jgi:hypothetical protein